MVSILRRQNGMDIVGQGGKIILFTLPSLAAAILAHTYAPQVASLPAGAGFLKPLAYVLLVPGLALWATAVTQLLTGFSRGDLVTTGAYGVVRNPIYASAIFFILPAVALLTQTWVYFVPAAFLYAGVMIFIGTEERQLAQAFGAAYGAYLTRVDRLIPFKRP
jgi:protein-S-isoprenylcysteine O-methyltransferase Ste14